MRASLVPIRAFSLPTGLAFLAFMLSGCGKAAPPIAPAPDIAPGILQAGDESPTRLSAGGSFFHPLQLGNHWGYERTVTSYFVPAGGPPDPAFGTQSRRDGDLVCVEDRAGHRYFVEQQSLPGSSLAWWVRYRQDGSGLYEADVSVALPPDCVAGAGRRPFDAKAVSARSGEETWAKLSARLDDPAQRLAYRAAWERVQARAAAIRHALGVEPAAGSAEDRRGGVAAGEITRLEYPLRPGGHWVIREDPRFESTVEGAEVLDLPVGHVPSWRIRIAFEDLGPDDHVHIWHGRSGFLKYVAHFEGVVTDGSGNPIGRMIADESEELVELSLDRGRFSAP